MTNRNETGTVNNTGTVIIAVVIMTCFAFACTSAIVLAIPDGSRAGAMVTILLAALGTSIGAITILVRQDKVREVAQDTNEKVDRVLNGEMDDKLAAAVHRVLDERKIANYSGDGSFKRPTA